MSEGMVPLVDESARDDGRQTAHHRAGFIEGQGLMRQVQRRSVQERPIIRPAPSRVLCVPRKVPSVASERPRGHALRDRSGSPMKH